MGGFCCLVLLRGEYGQQSKGEVGERRKIKLVCSSTSRSAMTIRNYGGKNRTNVWFQLSPLRNAHCGHSERLDSGAPPPAATRLMAHGSPFVVRCASRTIWRDSQSVPKPTLETVGG